MHFELWDTESKNLLYDFDTLAEALDATRQLVSLNSGRYPGQLALAEIDEQHRTSWLAKGEGLTPLLEGRSESPTRRVP